MFADSNESMVGKSKQSHTCEHVTSAVNMRLPSMAIVSLRLYVSTILSRQHIQINPPGSITLTSFYKVIGNSGCSG